MDILIFRSLTKSRYSAVKKDRNGSYVFGSAKIKTYIIVST